METSLLKKRFWNNLLLIIVLLAAGISYAHEIIPNRNSVHQSDAATVVTDKDDYQPGEYVIVSGSGWLPGETVQLHFDETPQVCTNDHDRFTVADANGNIYYNQFLINDRHLGVAFVLTATGQSSGYNAQTFFTDATWGLEVSTNGGSSYLINGAGPTVAFNSCETKQITFRITQQNNSNPNQSYTFALPAGFSISLPSSLAFFNAANNSISRSWNVSQYAANALCLSASSSSDALGSNQKIVFTCNVISVANVVSTEIMGRASNNATCLNPTGSSGVLMNTIRPKFSSSADTIPPVLTPGANQDVVLGSDCKIEIPDVKGSAVDNCSGVSIVQVPAAGEFVSSSHNGNVIVTVTATDAAGLTDIEEVTLTAKDETPPVLTPGANRDVTLGSDCKILIPDVKGSAVDNCSGVSIVQVPAAGELVSSSHNGEVVVTVTATDAAGLTDIEEVTLTAKDETPPVLTPGTDQDVVLGSDCKIEIPNVLGSATDNCSGVSIVQVPASGELVSSSHNGNVVVTVTATDAAGLTDIEEVTLTAKDETPPVLTPGTDQGVVLGSDCKIEIPNVLGSAIDNCSGVTIVQVPAAGEFVSSSHNGEVVVTVTATDAAGLTDIEEVTLTAKDETPPTINCPSNISQPNDTGLCSAVVNYVAPVGNDNCSGQSTVQIAGLASGAVFPVGVTTNTFEVTDAAGNKSSCSFTVTVSDNEAPLVPELSDITEECSVVVSAPATTDNCSEIVIGTTNDPLEYNEQGSYVIHWSFDDGNGNISQANQNVIIDDVTLPTITCPSDINLTACQDTATWALPEMQDNCSGVSLEQISGPESGSLFENGTTTTISYRATDVGGNTATCSFTVARAAELTATCATTNSQLYFGYTGDQTSTINVIPAGGEGPYTVSISMNRALLCNVITNSGDESWIPGANTNSNSNIGVSCPTSGTSSLLPISTSNAFVSGVYSVNVTLMEDATFTAIVTDANGCTVTCTITVIAEDVRCFAGASGRAKVMLCHKTGNTKNPCVNICVDENAVAEHLAHGDFLGRCTTDCTPPQSNVKPEVENADLFHVIAYPNPSSNQFTFEIESKSSDTINISVFDIAGRLVKVIENHQDTTVTFGEELPRGVYLAVIEQGSNRKTIRIIKE
ncbi:HYR domain-containing protein [Flavobacterium saliperosum]|uniref:Por secretion system C-terminal sorting domain-containing protein n=1 Tax=Flavobacterium saliperosum TaxID=329186 RepID=A0A1G4VDZ5_9FLAO|nr:HYR domain-containing protein [Flavobacterium saliperosum]SCX05293.1 Por secretion system C-terminal sorting domain-containing protein [Flavobacterium saliperosum]